MRLLARPLGRIPQPWRKVVDWVVTLAVAVVVVLVFEAEVAQPYRIPSSSMEHTLHCAKSSGVGCLGSTDDRILVFKLWYDFAQPERGQIVVFKAPSSASGCAAGDGGSTFVKRLIGLPGETLHENRQGYISVREPGSKTWVGLREPYVSAGSRRSDVHLDETWHVPKGEYFMLGDNRGQSCDSRTWGAVPRASLIGPVVFTYWPLDRIGSP